MIALTREELLREIDSLVIYDTDYKVIQKLLEYDPRFVAAVIEEIIKGNLYWSDFENRLPDEYEEILKESLEIQTKTLENIELVRAFNKDVMKINEQLVSKIGWEKNLLKGNDNYDELWKRSTEELREDYIYSMLLIKDTDNAIKRALKTEVFNAIENGRLAIEKEEPNSDIGGVVVSSNKEYRFINPNSILLSTDDLIIPVNFEKIILTDADIDFMRRNNISMDEMKKVKVIYEMYQSLKILKSNETEDTNNDESL